MPNEAISPVFLAFGLPSGSELIIILVIGLLIFGRRLPEVGRSVGKAIVEFKKGIKGIEEEIETESGPGGGAESRAGAGPRSVGSSRPSSLPDAEPMSAQRREGEANPYAATSDRDSTGS